MAARSTVRPCPLPIKLSVTHVDVSLEGDTFFPQIDPEVFEKFEETAAPAGEKDDFPVRFAEISPTLVNCATIYVIGY